MAPDVLVSILIVHHSRTTVLQWRPDVAVRSRKTIPDMPTNPVEPNKKE